MKRSAVLKGLIRPTTVVSTSGTLKHTAVLNGLTRITTVVGASDILKHTAVLKGLTGTTTGWVLVRLAGSIWFGKCQGEVVV